VFSSDLESPSALASDEDLERIWSKQHSLKDFLDRKNFKTYDELKTRLDKALGLTATSAAKPSASRATEVAPPWEDSEPAITSRNSSTDDDDEDVSFFKKLARD
jgi:hypothetical protein